MNDNLVIDRPLDSEADEIGLPPDNKSELRLWLRLLTCTKLIETEVRRRLADEFDTTLPRFDLMAQLENAPEGLTLGETSRRMMVSNGNVTGLAGRLAAEGLIERRTDPGDRRTGYLMLTPKGRAQFARMAEAHEAWVADLLQGLSPRETFALMALLARTKDSVRRTTRRKALR